MTMKHGRYMGGIRTLEDLRIRCRMDHDCWVWVMGKSHGVPSVCIVVNGTHKSMNGKRAAMILAGKNPTKDQCAVSRSCCPHPILCLNPAHAKLSSRKTVTSRSNVRPDLIAKNRLRGIKNRQNLAKLSESEVRQIRALRGCMKSREVADKFGVSQDNINLIWAGKTWRDVLDVPYNSVFGLAA